MRSTASKPRRRPWRKLHRRARQGHLLPRRRQLGVLPARQRRVPALGHRSPVRRLPRRALARRRPLPPLREAAEAALQHVRPQGLRRGRARQRRRLGKGKPHRLQDHQGRPAALQPLGRQPGPRPRDGGGAEERRPPGQAAVRATSTSRSSRSASSTTNAATTRTPSSTKARPSSRPSTNRSRRNTARPPRRSASARSASPMTCSRSPGSPACAEPIRPAGRRRRRSTRRSARSVARDDPLRSAGHRGSGWGPARGRSARSSKRGRAVLDQIFRALGGLPWREKAADGIRTHDLLHGNYTGRQQITALTQTSFAGLS